MYTFHYSKSFEYSYSVQIQRIWQPKYIHCYRCNTLEMSHFFIGSCEIKINMFVISVKHLFQVWPRKGKIATHPSQSRSSGRAPIQSIGIPCRQELSYLFPPGYTSFWPHWGKILLQPFISPAQLSLRVMFPSLINNKGFTQNLIL